jgi:Tol biopolymer transport system component
LYYVRRDHRQQTSQVLRRDLASGAERELRELSGSDGYRISLSPDGRRLAFSNAGDDKKLQVMPVEGGETRLLFQFEPHGYGVPHTWTPDGRFILFTTGANRRTLCRIPAEGGKVQELWPNVLSLGPITVHPDGRHIAFAAATEIDSAQDIWVMRNFLPGPAASGSRSAR